MYMPPKRTRSTQSGSGLLTKAKALVKKAHDFAKKEKLLSKALDHFGQKNLANHARLAGYGKRRRRAA
jgi:hypothetical protein